MPTDYCASRDNINSIMNSLANLSERIDDIRPENRKNYPNAQLRSWSGYVRDLENFTAGLEEWIRQPEAAESRRFLAEINEWAGSGRQPLLEQIFSDSKFLSDNTESIKEIHENLGDISFGSIKKSGSFYVVRRLVEKDVVRAFNWSVNAKTFSTSIERLEAKTVSSLLPKQVLKDVLKELTKVNSFAEEQQSIIDTYFQLVVKAEVLTSSVPIGIPDRALLESYKRGIDASSGLDRVNDILTSIRKLLVDLEWVVEIQNDSEYKPLWTARQTALNGKSLDNIEKLLSDLQRSANEWKVVQKHRLDGEMAKLRRMSDSLEQEVFSQQIQKAEVNIKVIDWNKPDVQSIISSIDETRAVLEDMRKELLGKLNSQDAMSIVENPEIIADMGEGIGWTFVRFIKALEITLREGLIEIQAVEKK